MRKKLAVVLAAAMMCTALAGCSSKPAETKADAGTKAVEAEAKPAETKAEAGAKASGGVTISVVTAYSGNDSNADNFKNAVKEWESTTGNKVEDGSAISDETFKTRVQTDFETGAEPDVLMFFSGADADSFLDKVVSIDEIRKEYPDYASNMDMNKIPASSDGVKYAVPVNGYWEGMFVNKKILADCGLEVPGADTTWDEFMEMCATIKEKGYTPVSCSLAKEIHYWFEFCIFNHGDVATHNLLPADMSEAGRVVEGITDIKSMYEAGCFQENTFSMDGQQAKDYFIQGKAAFYCDGSWALGSIAEGVENVEDYTVTYVPGNGSRKASDIIGGMSSGYFITKKAWNDPEIRDTAVAFVEFMTNDKNVADFSGIAVTALKKAPEIDTSEFNQLQKDSLVMTGGATGIALALQDGIRTEARVPVFDNMSDIASGNVSVEEAVEEMVNLINE